MNKLFDVLGALLGVALLARGAYAFALSEYWVSPRHSAPVLLQGPPAQWMGASIAFLGLGVLLALSSRHGVPPRRAYLLSGLAFAGSIACFVLRLLA